MASSKQQDLLESMNWRYAVKKFDSAKKISAADWKILEESLRLSPSSFGLQPWKFLVIQNPKLREQLTAASWKQSQVEDCSHFVVVTRMKKVSEDYIRAFVSDCAAQRGVSAESLESYAQMMMQYVARPNAADFIPHWTARQAYIAMGFFMLAASQLRIDVCPMEGIDPAKYDEILSLNTGDYGAVAALAAGYRAADDKYQQLKKVRFESAKVIETR